MNRILKCFFILICTLSLQKGYSQDRTIDSLKLAFKNAKQDTIIINTLMEIGKYHSANNPDTSIYYYKLAKKESQRANNLLKFGETLIELGWNNKAVHNYKESINYYQDAKNTFLKLLDQSKTTIQTTKLKKYIERCYSEEGSAYGENSDYAKALESYFQAVKINQEIGNYDKLAKVLGNIGVVYGVIGDNQKALIYYFKAVKICAENGNKKFESINYGRIGIAYFQLKNYSKAMEYYNKSLEICELIGNKKQKAFMLRNIGGVYQTIDKTELALKYFLKALKLNEEIKNDLDRVLCFGNIGELYIKLHRYKEAEHYVIKYFNLATEINSFEDVIHSHRILSELYEKTHNTAEALKHFKIYIQYRDSLSNQENSKKIMEQEIKFNYQKKAATDSIIHADEARIKDSELAKRIMELKTQRIQQYALYGGLAIVLIFAGFMFNRFKVTQKQKQIIEVKEQETQLQKHLIEEKHREITDSINYAERIQRSFIATKEMLDGNLNDYFVFFKPKDVVSGDFYWAAKLNNGNFALTTADSTGHGVPGAIMSLLNITSLEKAIETLTEPSEILNSTRKTIIDRLKKDGSEFGGKDGMDCSLISFDFNKNKLTIAAANNPVWIVRGTETIDIKADKMPVGKHDRDTTSFTQQEIDLQKGDVVYTLTDGFPDQFGGEKGKKFMSKNLRELLALNAHLPMNEQKELLVQTFKNWVGDNEQVDDITLMGIRV